MADNVPDDKQLAVGIHDNQSPIVFGITAVGYGPIRVTLNGRAIYEGDPDAR